MQCAWCSEKASAAACQLPPSAAGRLCWLCASRFRSTHHTCLTLHCTPSSRACSLAILHCMAMRRVCVCACVSVCEHADVLYWLEMPLYQGARVRLLSTRDWWILLDTDVVHVMYIQWAESMWSSLSSHSRMQHSWLISCNWRVLVLQEEEHEPWLPQPAHRRKRT